MLGGDKVAAVLRVPCGAPRPDVTPRSAQQIGRAVCWKDGKAVELDRGWTNLDNSLFLSTVTFPGEDAPGTGLRHLPEPEDAVLAATESHAMRTTNECYEMFPHWLRASCPLEVEDTEPTGLSALSLPDAGPNSGPRHRPGPAESDHPPLDPSLPKTVSARLRDLKIRHGRR
eukprot:evm.model.scf_2433.1 EVM.evm.TU.scf_2433.1   scf_2433:2414-3458(+)